MANMRSNGTKATPLPLQKVCLLGLVLSANNTSIWMIFSFLPFMVEFYFPYLTKSELGYRAGILGSAFSAGSLLGNLIWGTVSDRFGRRPALLCGLLGTAISSTMFGFSPTFAMAVASRFMWGLLNGNIGVAKTYLAEICDDTNSAKGMALFGVIGGFGRTIGPIIGGFLSTPAKTFPGTFKGTIFDTYPFALPSLIIALNCLFVFIVSFFALSETLPMAESRREITNGANKDGGGTYSLLHEKDEEEEEERTSGSSNNSINDSIISNNSDQMSIEMTPTSLQRNRSFAGDNNGIAEEEDEESKDQRPFETPGKLKRKLTFAGVVTVKTIGSQALGFGPLKGVDAKDHPLSVRHGRDTAGDSSRRGQHDEFIVEDIEQGESHLLEEEDNHRSPPYSPLPAPLPTSTAIATQQKNQAFRSSSSSDNSEGDDRHHHNQQQQDQLQRKNSSNSVGGEEEDEDGETTKLIDPHQHHKHVIGKVRYTNGSEDETVITRGRGFWRMISNIFQQPEIMISTALYGTNALSIVVFNEIFSLWVVTSKDSGGFEFSSYQIGVSTMISGMLGIILQVTLYPYMTDRLGVLAVHKAGVFAFAISCLVVPCVSLVNKLHSPFLTWTMVIASLLLINVTSTWVLVSVFVLINNSCYSYQRATVNGLGQTFASLGRLTGPYVGANLFAWSENNGLSWPLNFYLVFYVMAFIGFGNWILANQLPLNIQRRKKEPGVAMPPRRRRRRYADEEEEEEYDVTSANTANNILIEHHLPLASNTTTSNRSSNSGGGSYKDETVMIPTPHMQKQQMISLNKGQGIPMPQ